LSDDESLAFVNKGVAVIANFGTTPVQLPAGEVLVTTQHDLTAEHELQQDQVVWIKLA
jgi:alpha-glucosidase